MKCLKELQKIQQKFEDEFGSEAYICDSECSYCATENHPESEKEENEPQFERESDQGEKEEEIKESIETPLSKKSRKIDDPLAARNLGNMTFTAPVIDKLVTDI